MDRRNFLKQSFLLLGGISTGCRRTEPSKKLKIQYAREEIPPFEIPPYRGQTYSDTVPDTLDIAERSKLAIHCLTSITDPDADYEIYMWGMFFRNPVVMVHDFNDWCLQGEGLMEALPLLRVATGSDLNHHVDPEWMKVALKSIGPDGLEYIPLNGRPWSRIRPYWVDPMWRADGSATDTNDLTLAQLTNPFVCTRTIGAMTAYYTRDQNPMWKQTIKKMIQRLIVLSVDKGDYRYIPAGGYEPNAKVGPTAEMPTGILSVEHGNGRLIQGLAQYYRATGYEPARELAGKACQLPEAPRRVLR